MGNKKLENVEVDDELSCYESDPTLGERQHDTNMDLTNLLNFGKRQCLKKKDTSRDEKVASCFSRLEENPINDTSYYEFFQQLLPVQHSLRTILYLKKAVQKLMEQVTDAILFGKSVEVKMPSASENIEKSPLQEKWFLTIGGQLPVPHSNHSQSAIGSLDMTVFIVFSAFISYTLFQRLNQIVLFGSQSLISELKILFLFGD